MMVMVVDTIKYEGHKKSELELRGKHLVQVGGGERSQKKGECV